MIFIFLYFTIHYSLFTIHHSLFIISTYRCHGIPDERPLEEGDFVNIDITLFKEGVHGDNSVMVQLGEVHPEVKTLIDVT